VASERAVSAGEQFKEAYLALLGADQARQAGDNPRAVQLYGRALELYSTLGQTYPQWQPGVVEFRTRYCRYQLDALRSGGDASVRPSDEPVTDDRIPPSESTVAQPDTDPAAEPATVPARRCLRVIQREGRHLLETGRALEARELLTEGLHLFPDDPGLCWLLAGCYCRLGDFEAAVPLLLRVADAGRDDPGAGVALAAAYAAAGLLDTAREELEEVLGRYPDTPDAHYNMAGILLNEQPPDTDGARGHYGRMRSLGGAADREMEAVLYPVTEQAPDPLSERSP
jgi:tetratricopeptide (TPR) repeat protein